MDNGFGTNLEGFLIKGNLSVFPGCQPEINGDGSLEAAGTFYVGSIKEYNINSGINIQNVIFSTNYVQIPYTTTSYGKTNGSLLLNGGITINNTTDSTSISSGGTFTSLGGMSIAKSLNVGGTINLNNNKIVNVSWPTDPLDGVNKAYVDSKINGNTTSGNILNGNFSSGQLLFGGDNNTIIGNNNLLYTSGQLVLTGTNANVLISNGSIDVKYNFIHNVSPPILGLDAVNKEYVDNLYDGILGLITSGNTNNTNGFGHISEGQIVVGGNGVIIEGCNTFVYTSGNLFITNTENAIGIGTGGALTISGGLSIASNVFIGGVLDVGINRIENVNMPILGYDAVNKDYLQAIIQNLSSNEYILHNYNYQNTFILNNNVTVPETIPFLDIDATNTLGFITIIYINSNGVSSLYTIYSYYTGTKWFCNSNFTGNQCNVNFYIENLIGSTIANISYTNLNQSGETIIQYYVEENIQVIPNTTQFNYSLIASDNLYIDFLSYISSNILAVKIYVHVSMESDASLFIFDLFYNKNTNSWIMNYDRIGNDIGVIFKLGNLSNIGSIQYNSKFIATARVVEYKILDSFNSYMLLNNVQNTIIPETIQLITQQYTQIYIYVEKIGEGYAFYSIDAYYFNNEWYTNTKFIGDYLNIKFSVNANAILEYTNPDTSTNTIVKILCINPIIQTPLPVADGGTGNNYLEPYSVLLGNGTGPIINTTNLTYIDTTLNVIGNISTSNLLSINADIKQLHVQDLYANSVNITPSIGDLNENIFYANNNQSIYTPITYFRFDATIVKTFISQISITITTIGYQYDTLIILKGINSNSGWCTNYDFIGNNINNFFNITIDSTGQINYTSENIPGWISTKIRFRAETTSI